MTRLRTVFGALFAAVGMLGCKSDAAGTLEPTLGSVPSSMPRVFAGIVGGGMSAQTFGGSGTNTAVIFDLARFGLTTTAATLRVQRGPGGPVDAYAVISAGVDNTLTNIRPPIISTLPGFVPFTLHTAAVMFWRAESDYVVAFSVIDDRTGAEPLVGVVRQLGKDVWIGGIESDFVGQSQPLTVGAFSRSADCRDRSAVVGSCALGSMSVESPRLWLYRYTDQLAVRDSISVEIPRTVVNAASTMVDAAGLIR